MRRVHAFIAFFGTAGLVACHDTPQPTGTGRVAAENADTRGAATLSRTPVTPAEFHARNRMDWVGVAHNAAMDDLRASIRSSRPRDLCKVIERIGADAGQASGHTAGVTGRERASIARSAVERIGCRGKGGTGSHAAERSRALRPGPVVRLASSSSTDYEMSAAGWAIADQIQAAGESAGSAGELASELAGIVSGAGSLSADDQSVIDALASVSLSSFEYWEANGPAMAQEMADAYGDCIAGGTGDSCYYAISASPRMRAATPLVQLASFSPPVCNIDTGLIWRGDKWGAGVGLAIGMTTRTVQGAIVGLVVGAAVGSGGAATYEFGNYLKCAFK